MRLMLMARGAKKSVNEVLDMADRIWYAFGPSIKGTGSRRPWPCGLNK
jgi:hypothetical protein